jgi:UPF0716 protein FxsA
MKILFFVFIIVSMIELYLLISIGGAIGAGWTVILVIATAVLGAALVRAQGMSTYARVQQQVRAGQPPAQEMIEGAFLLFAGALLFAPGFFTDAVGFACLTPPIRRYVIARFFARLKPSVPLNQGTPNQGVNDGQTTDQKPKTIDVIEGEYRKID